MDSWVAGKALTPESRIERDLGPSETQSQRNGIPEGPLYADQRGVEDGA